MQNHICKLTRRQLSSGGKATLSNKLTAYLSNVFRIPDEVLTKIHKIIFHYLWQNKKVEPIARKTTFLPKNKGGLNIKEPHIHNLAMQLKHLQTLQKKKKKKNQPPWMNLATYMLTKDIYNYGQNYSYFKSNNISKTTTPKNQFYYQDLIQYIRSQNPNIFKLKNEIKIIYKDVLQKASQNHVTAGEIQWKNILPSLDFTKIWKNAYFSFSPPHTSNLPCRLLHH